MNPDAVAQYLQHNPKFFDTYADMLAQIFVPHPHGGRAISLPERQILTLREKSKTLEHTLAQLLETGHGNDALAVKMHRLTLAVLRLPKDAPDRIIETLTYHLREDFSVPHTAFRVWGVRAGFESIEGGLGASSAMRGAVASATSPLKLPYCGPVAHFKHDDAALGGEVAGWFGDTGAHVKSLAVMSLISVHAGGGSGAGGDHGASAGGVLVLGSEDEQRFYAGMGTMYLERLAELLSAALEHIFP